MKITEVKTIVVDCFRTNWVFVKVETDEGYLQSDSSHAGGIAGMKQIAAICDARHIPFCAPLVAALRRHPH